jgi:hypothetical protein
MPRKPIDWSKALFYRLVCRDPTITECYVGSTTNEVKRRSCHKSRCTIKTDPYHNLFVYRFIRSMGGWDNWQLIVIEHRPVNNKKEASIRERFFVEQYKAKLNKQVPSRTPAEYRVDHADEIKQYRVDHKEKLNKQSAAWNLANEAYSKTKHICECGGHYTTAGKIQHIKSKNHIAFAAVPK